MCDEVLEKIFSLEKYLKIVPGQSQSRQSDDHLMTREERGSSSSSELEKRQQDDQPPQMERR
jgi:hypothetical protein